MRFTVTLNPITIVLSYIEINKFRTIKFGTEIFRTVIFGQFPLLVRQTLHKNNKEIKHHVHVTRQTGGMKMRHKIGFQDFLQWCLLTLYNTPFLSKGSKKKKLRIGKWTVMLFIY